MTNKILFKSVLLIFSLSLGACTNGEQKPVDNSVDKPTNVDNSEIVNTDKPLTILQQTNLVTNLPSVNYSCPTPTKTPNAEYNDLYFDVVGLDEESFSNLEIRIRLLQTDWSNVYSDYSLNKSGCQKFVQNTKEGLIRIANSDPNNKYREDYKLFLENPITSTGQKCAIKSPTSGKTNFTDVVVKIDCRTPVVLKSFVPKNQSIDFSEQEYYLALPKAEAENAREIKNPSLKFTSSDSSIASVDAKTGKLVFHKVGKVKISLSANPDFYTSEPLEYWVEAKNTDIKIQKLEIGQSSILPIGSSEQIIAPNNKTLIRALVYAPNSATLQTAKLTISSDKGETSMALTCPTKLNNKKFAENHYKLSDTCYTILDKLEKLKNLKSDSLLKFEFNGISKYATPKVSKELNFKITLVKGKNFRGEPEIPTHAQVERQLRQVYPLSNVDIKTRSQSVTLDVANNLGTALNAIDKLRKQEDTTRHYYGFIKSNACGGTIGLGYVGMPSAVGMDLSSCKHVALEQTMMHELGHNLGLGHAPCGTTQGITDKFWKSNAYPGSDQAQLTQAPLFLQASNEVKSPNNPNAHQGKETDVMAYCGGTRLSNHNYTRVTNFMQGGKIYQASASVLTADLASAYEANEQAQPQVLAYEKPKYQRIISGEILYDSNKVILQPIELTSNQLDEVYKLNPFGYKVKITTAKGSFIYPLQMLQIDHSPALRFELILPINDMQDEIQQISFWQGDTIIPHEIEVPNSEEAQAPPAFSQNSTSLRSAKSQRLPTLGKGELANFKYNTIVWNAEKYKFMTSVFIEKTGARYLLTSQAQGGFFTVEQKLQNGRLEIYLSDGINNQLKSIDLN